MITRSSLIIGDVFLAIASVRMSYVALNIEMSSSLDLLQILPFCTTIIVSSFMIELYNIDRFMKVQERFMRIIVAVLISFLLLSSIYYMVPPLKMGRRLFLLSIGMFCFLQFLWHLAYSSVSKAPGFSRRVLVLGTGRLAQKVGDIITSTDCHHNLVGYVSLEKGPAQVPGEMILGTSRELCDVVKKHKVQRLVSSLTERRGVFPLQDLLTCKFGGVDIIDAPSFFEEITGKLLIENIRPSWFIFSNDFKLTQRKRIFKRLFDIAASIVGIVVSAPLFPFIMLAIRLDSKGPAFFKQLRVGERGRNFLIYKFRTMRTDAEGNTGAVWAQENDPRITRVGSFLRKTRLDELPQLFNIFKGDMSLIGPRPERPEFIEDLSKQIPFYSERHAVRPGLTGWAQIRYPYGSSVEDAIEKLRYDLFYIKNMSMLFDVGIVLETIKVMLFGRGAR